MRLGIKWLFSVLLLLSTSCAFIHRSEQFKGDYYYISDATKWEATGQLGVDPKTRWTDFFSLMRTDDVLDRKRKATLFDHAQSERTQLGLPPLESFGITKAWVLREDGQP